MASKARVTALSGQKVVIDDMIYKLHYIATSSLLVFCSFFILADVIWSGPIKCGSNSSEQAVDLSYCWRLGLYTTTNQTLKAGWENHAIPILGKYHFAIQLLLVEAIAFIVPYFLWTRLEDGYLYNILLGLNVDGLLKTDPRIKSVAKNFQSGLNQRSRYFWNYICCLFFNFGNTCLQGILIGLVFRINFYTYGIKFVKGLFEVTTYANMVTSPTLDFPLLAYCIVPDTFGGIGNRNGIPVYNYGICMITINEINKIVFALLWVWFIGLGIFTFVATIYTVKKYTRLEELKFQSVQEEAKRKFGSELITDWKLLRKHSGSGDVLILTQIIRNIRSLEVAEEFIKEVNKLLLNSTEKASV